MGSVTEEQSRAIILEWSLGEAECWLCKSTLLTYFKYPDVFVQYLVTQLDAKKMT